jgi:predicted nucleic acid-binding protein
MTAYVDASVLLRLVLGQPQRFRQWRRVKVGVASMIIEVECLRTLDRLRVADGLADEDIADLREAVYRLLDSFELVEPTRVILARAALPMPTTLGTLDAIHLATALAWREHHESELTMLTHDDALAIAARAYGMPVQGV